MNETNMNNRPLLVNDPNLETRKPLEWAKIYYIKLVGKQKVKNKLMNEYEFAWSYVNALNFIPVKDDMNDYDTYSDFNIRAQGLLADMFINATIGEKETLKTKYVDTNFVRRQLSYI